MTPRRIQRKRTKGWRLPVGAIVVTRPTKWGNPWREGATLTREQAVESFRNSFERDCQDPEFLARLRAELGGRDLACWCAPGTPCHADVLLEIANRDDCDT